MKKLNLLLIAFLLCGGNAFAAYTNPTDPGLVESGPQSAGEPVKVYRLVRNPISNANQASFASSDVVIWDLVSDDGVTVNYTNNVGISVSNDAVAGVVVGSIPTAESTAARTAVQDLGKRNWGYIQIYGPALAKTDDSNITAGEGLRASSTDAKATASGSGDAINGTDSLGFALDASSSSGTVMVFVRTR